MSEIPRKKKVRRRREAKHKSAAENISRLIQKHGFKLLVELGIGERSFEAFKKAAKEVEQWQVLKSARHFVARKKDEETAACGGPEEIADRIKENLGSFGDDFGGSEEASSFGYSDAKECEAATAKVVEATKKKDTAKKELLATKEQLKNVIMVKVVVGLINIVCNFAKLEGMGSDLRRMEARLKRVVKEANRLCNDLTTSSDDWQDVMDQLQALADEAEDRAAEARIDSSTMLYSAVGSIVTGGSILLKASKAPASSGLLFASAAVDAVFGTVSLVHWKKYSKLAEEFMEFAVKVDECQDDLEILYKKLRRNISRQIK